MTFGVAGAVQIRPVSLVFNKKTPAEQPGMSHTDDWLVVSFKNVDPGLSKPNTSTRINFAIAMKKLILGVIRKRV